MRTFLPQTARGINDLKENHKQSVLHNIQVNTILSLSYFILLISSSIICTLGLLMDAPAIVIGGMIISPLMWPLMKIAMGISYESKAFVWNALLLLLFSIFVSLVSAYIITLLSPLKSITGEIQARTTPTLLDTIIALTAGGVAALALVQKRISEHVAGVAIATSLMPPLCVIGIGLALFHNSTFVNSSLLFTTNVLSIIFVSLITFTLLGIKRNTAPIFKRNGEIIIVLALLITGIPLFFFLQSYSFKAYAHKESQEIMQENLAEISPAIRLQNVKLNLEKVNSDNLITVEADILLPENITISYPQQQTLITALEQSLKRDIDLKLRIQRMLSLESAEDRQSNLTKNMISSTFLYDLQVLHPTLSIDSLTVRPSIDQVRWYLHAVLRGDPSLTFTDTQRQLMQDKLSEVTNTEVIMTIEIIPRIIIGQLQEIEHEKIQKSITAYFSTLSSDIDITELQIEPVIIRVSLTAPSTFVMSGNDAETLKQNLLNEFGKEYLLEIHLLRKQITQY